MKTGKRIKTLRKTKGITLVELAEASGIALATLSRMENDKMPGTLEAYEKIVKALDVSLSELFRSIEDTAKQVDIHSKISGVEYFSGKDEIIHELLISNVSNKKMIPTLFRIKQSSQSKPGRRAAGIEMFVYMLSGSAEFLINGKSYALKKGGSLYFDASLEHYIINKARRTAEILTLTTKS